MADDTCGYTVLDDDGHEEPCDRPATGWRWYQDVEHEPCLERACVHHVNEGGERMHRAEADYAAVRVEVEEAWAARYEAEARAEWAEVQWDCHKARAERAEAEVADRDRRLAAVEALAEAWACHCHEDISHCPANQKVEQLRAALGSGSDHAAR